jgi:hypothetical protein
VALVRENYRLDNTTMEGRLVVVRSPWMEEEDSLWVSSGEVGGKEPGRSGAAEVFFLFSFSSSFWDCWMEGVRVCVCVCVALQCSTRSLI